MTPLRNVAVTTPCPVCGRPFVPIGRQRVCSSACRQAAWRRRQAAPLPSIPRRTSQASTIYACPTCDARYLGEQRCAECGTFCRKLGPGAPCPHCDEPVLLADLLVGMEAGVARRP
jgi:hypothetical protein